MSRGSQNCQAKWLALRERSTPDPTTASVLPNLKGSAFGTVPPCKKCPDQVARGGHTRVRDITESLSPRQETRRLPVAIFDRSDSPCGLEVARPGSTPPVRITHRALRCVGAGTSVEEEAGGSGSVILLGSRPGAPVRHCGFPTATSGSPTARSRAESPQPRLTRGQRLGIQSEAKDYVTRGLPIMRRGKPGLPETPYGVAPGGQVQGWGGRWSDKELFNGRQLHSISSRCVA